MVWGYGGIRGWNRGTDGQYVPLQINHMKTVSGKFVWFSEIPNCLFRTEFRSRRHADDMMATLEYYTQVHALQCCPHISPIYIRSMDTGRRLWTHCSGTQDWIDTGLHEHDRRVSINQEYEIKSTHARSTRWQGSPDELRRSHDRHVGPSCTVSDGSWHYISLHVVASVVII